MRKNYGSKKNLINYYEIGKRVKKIRIQQEMTQQELAAKADISVNYVSHIENGLSKFSLAILFKIIKALNTTPNRILCTNEKDDTEYIIEDIECTLRQLSYEQLEFLQENIDLLRNYRFTKLK